MYINLKIMVIYTNKSDSTKTITVTPANGTEGDEDYTPETIVDETGNPTNKPSNDDIINWTVATEGGARRRRKTMKKMSKRKMMKWCKSKKNRRTKAGRKMCKKMKK